MRRFLSVLFCIMLSLAAFSQVSVESKIDSMRILVGQQTHMVVEVTAKKNSNVTFPFYEKRKMLVPGVEVLGACDGDTVETDGLVKFAKIYTLTSFDENLYALPPINVKVNGKTYKSNSLALKVLTCEVDTLHPEKFFPMKGVQNNPFLWSEWSVIIWMSIFGLLLLIAAFYLYVCLKRNKPIIAKVRIIKHVPPHKTAIAEIQRLKAENFETVDDQKAYYTKLTGTLRQYIKERFGFNAMEMTSSEILYELNKIEDKTMLDELRELFNTADLVKFAKYSTLLNEKDLNLVNALNFIDQTKREDSPTEEIIVPKLSDEEISSRNSRILVKTLAIACVLSVSAIIIYVIYNIYLLVE